MFAADATDPVLTDLQTQNRELRQEVQSQQRQIDELRQRLDALQNAGPRPRVEPRPAPPEPEPPARTEPVALRAAHEIRVSGEAGLAFFKSGDLGTYPNGGFHVDDAKIYIEAPVWQNVYIFAGLELATREYIDDAVHRGEVYADVEDLLTAGHDFTLNLRVGRFNIPFGEEYQLRGTVDNPLISHSMADVWGYDQGVEIYGKLGPVGYVVAVQNGGSSTRHDFAADKSATARLSLHPLPPLELSASAHRSGQLDRTNDVFSEIWFGGAFFRPLGAAAPPQTFSASLFQGDAAWRWKQGHLKAAAGLARYDDDHPAANDARRLQFYSIEILQQLADKLYGAARYSAVHAPAGYPIAGQGNAGKYFYNPYAPLTTDLHRLSLGLDYRFGPPLVWKVEYSWESGRLVGGAKRTDEDQFSTELGLKF